MVACLGRHNIVVDALSQKEVVAYIMTLSEVISDFNEKIKQAVGLDAGYEKLRQQVRNGGTIKYWLEGELFMFKGGRLYVSMGGLRKELLKEIHDAKWVGHPGEEQTMALLSRSYYWKKKKG